MGSSRPAAARAGLIAALLGQLVAGPALAAACQPDRLSLRGPLGGGHLSVEVADDTAERARGLMFRTDLADDAGMLFVYPAPHTARFWMKNTLIPLDMIFADPAGRVLTVHEGAIPEDERLIDGGPGVQFVLEVKAGRARAMGITPGTELRHPAIIDAAWPCD